MAVVAGIAAGDVGRVFARRRDAIVAGATGAYDLGVIDGKRGRPDTRRVAILADIGRLYMCRRLAGGLRAVVAAHAIASDIDVVEGGRQPGNRRMAVVAGIAAGDVGWMFTGRRDAIMAGAASAQYLGVIDGKGGRPDIRRVAVLANIGCLYMCRRLAGGLRAIVAAHAIASDIDVVEVGRQPGNG